MDRSGEERTAWPSVGDMNGNLLLRIGAVAAVLAVIAQLAAAMLEPGRVGDADKAIRKISEMDDWTVRWLVHTTGILLIIAALSIVTRTFSAGPGKEWSRTGVPLIATAGALGVAEVLVGASTKDLADGWAAAAPGANSAYFAAFEGAWDVTVNLDFGAIVVFSLYQLTLAAAILSSTMYRRWLGWASALGGVLALFGIVVELWSPVGTALDAVGALVFFVVLIALGVAMWRRAAVSDGLAAGP
jgi:hypothetical protein